MFEKPCPNQHKLNITELVLGIAKHRLFKPIGIKKDDGDKLSF
jgi:hypothetical protein